MWPDSVAARLLLILLLIGGAGACSEQAEPESFLIPSGYVGEVYVIFDISDGAAPEIRDGQRIYRIPPSGVLRTRIPPAYGRGIWSFAYVGTAGDVLDSIPRGPVGKLHDTPENRAHTAVEIHDLQSRTAAWPVSKPGTARGPASCAVKYYRFFVGTRAQYLDGPQTDGIDQLLERHPAPCQPDDRAA